MAIVIKTSFALLIKRLLISSSKPSICERASISEDEIDSKTFKDVISALDGLGYKEKESKKALKQLDLDNFDQTIENLIREVLKILNG